MIEIACAECGARFHRNAPRQKFCSKKCYRANAGLIYRPDASEKYEPKTLSCKHCKGSFEKFGNQTYCSGRCQRAARRKTMPEWYRSRYLKNKTSINARNMRLYHQTRKSSPWKILISMAKIRAKQKGNPFDLTFEWGERRWSGICELTGIPFVFGNETRGPFSPSIDQIKPKQGYTKDNTRFVLWAVNSMKGEGSDDDMFRIAEALISNRPSGPR